MIDNLLSMLEGISSVLDDVAIMSKTAMQKTAGVVGDDLALNAEQVSGVRAERELHVVWAVAKGSALNKLILVPVALGLSAFLPILITPLLVVGGIYLCFEGVEKVWHKASPAPAHAPEQASPLPAKQVDLLVREKEKVRGAARTDFILSAEILVIALGTFENVSFGRQALTLTVVAVAMTVGVYGLVAGIVKLDDLGLYLTRSNNAAARGIGNLILSGAPKMMRVISVVGTIAMFLVGGSILIHALAPAERALIAFTAGKGGLVSYGIRSTAELVIGVFAGAIALAAVSAAKRIKGPAKVA